MGYDKQSTRMGQNHKEGCARIRRNKTASKMTQAWAAHPSPHIISIIIGAKQKHKISDLNKFC